MTGILELFADLSGPDEFEQRYQLELFAWARRERNREASRRYEERVRQDQARLEARRARQRAAYVPRPRVLVDHVTAQRREYRRQWMAAKRAEARAA